MFWKENIFLSFAFAFRFFVNLTDAACQGQDASWDPDRGPLITQPSKSDPAKVMLDWSNVIRNQRCVDEYSVWVWIKGTPKERGRKLPVPGQTTLSFIVEVDSCVDYSFEVEFLEKNTLWAPVTRVSAISHFKTEAIPQLKSRDKNLFIVGYYFDASKGLHDLSKVSIKFPKKIMDHPNCIKHLEIKGNLDMNALSASQDFSISGALGQIGGGSQSPQQPGKPGKAAPGQLSNQTLLRELPQARLMYPDHHHEQGWHGRRGFVFQSAPSLVTVTGSTTTTTASTTTTPEKKSRVKRFLGKKTTTTTTVKPLLTQQQSLTSIVPPPFLFDTIEAIVEGVEACKPYIFTLKVYSPRNAVMGEIEGLKLLPLNQIYDYHPPSLKNLFQIDVVSTGQPVIKWQPGLGVPAACLPTFFEAVDIHIQRLEDDIIYHVNQEINTKTHVKYFNDELKTSQKASLTQYGCKCNSSVIKLTSTDPITLSKIPHLLGLYHYDNVHQGKPFFRMPSKHQDREPDFLIPPNAQTPPPHHQPHHQPQPPAPGGYGGGTRVKRFIGKIPGSPTGSNTQNPYDQPPAYPPPPTPQPIPMWSVPTTSRSTTANWFFPTPPPTLRPYPGPGSPTAVMPVNTHATAPPGGIVHGQGGPAPPPLIATPMKIAFFLYWDPLEKSWLMSNILGGSLPWIKGQKNSALLCPADPGNFKTWSYEDRARPGQWINDPTLKFECVL